MTAPPQKSTTERIARIFRGLAKTPLVFAALERRYGPGVVRRRAAARVVVFPALGLAFNRIKKNANTSTVILLRQIETGALEDRDVAKWRARRYFDLSRAELAALDRLHTFVIIRDPYARVLSAFLDKFRDQAYQRRYGPFDLTPEGFARFVNWLSAGGLKRDAHWDLQTKLMMLPLSRYDTVLRFEEYPACLRNFLTARGFALPPEALADLFPSDGSKRTGASAQLPRFYTPDVAAKVARLYAEDFAALGYPVAPGPFGPHPALQG